MPLKIVAVQNFQLNGSELLISFVDGPMMTVAIANSGFHLARRFGPPDVRTRTSAPGYAGFGLTHTLNERRGAARNYQWLLFEMQCQRQSEQSFPDPSQRASPQSRFRALESAGSKRADCNERVSPRD